MGGSGARRRERSKAQERLLIYKVEYKLKGAFSNSRCFCFFVESEKTQRESSVLHHGRRFPERAVRSPGFCEPFVGSVCGGCRRGSADKGTRCVGCTAGEVEDLYQGEATGAKGVVSLTHVDGCESCADGTRGDVSATDRKAYIAAVLCMILLSISGR